MKSPNNFPREGMQSTVTKSAVRKLEQERPVLNAELHYTIGGDCEASVHTNLNAEREAAITNGSRRLNMASEAIAKGFAVARPDDRTQYIQAQRQAAKQFHKSRDR